MNRLSDNTFLSEAMPPNNKTLIEIRKIELFKINSQQLLKPSSGGRYPSLNGVGLFFEDPSSLHSTNFEQPNFHFNAFSDIFIEPIGVIAVFKQ